MNSRPGGEASERQPGESRSAPEVQDQSGDYILQRGDEIEIRVFNVSALTQTVKIRPDGKISILLLDNIPAAGLTTSQLDEVITARYGQLYREPEVTIIVQTFTSQQVYVGGEVNQPGMFSLPAELTVLGAVTRAGGLKETAKAKEVVLLRNKGNDEPLMMKLNLEDVFKKGARDVRLQPFDVVFVPKSRIAKLDAFVNQYIRQVLPISLSGGFTYLLGEQARINLP